MPLMATLHGKKPTGGKLDEILSVLYEISPSSYWRETGTPADAAVLDLIRRIMDGVHFKRYADGKLVVHRRNRRQTKEKLSPEDKVGHILVKLASTPRNVSHLFVKLGDPPSSRRSKQKKSRSRASPKSSRGKIATFIVPLGPNEPEEVKGSESELSKDRSAPVATADLLNVIDGLMQKVDSLERAVRNDQHYRARTANITNDIMATVDRLETRFLSRKPPVAVPVVQMSAAETPAHSSSAVVSSVQSKSQNVGPYVGMTSVLVGQSTSLYCAIDTSKSVKTMYWINPVGAKINTDTTSDRYTTANNMLYIHHTLPTDHGTYRCIVEQEDGTILTAEASLAVSVCSDQNPCHHGGTCLEVPAEEELQNIDVEVGSYRRALVQKYATMKCVCAVGYYGLRCQHVEKTNETILYVVILLCVAVIVSICVICGCCVLNLHKGLSAVIKTDTLGAKVAGYDNYRAHDDTNVHTNTFLHEDHQHFARYPPARAIGGHDGRRPAAEAVHHNDDVRAATSPRLRTASSTSFGSETDRAHVTTYPHTQLEPQLHPHSQQPGVAFIEAPSHHGPEALYSTDARQSGPLPEPVILYGILPPCQPTTPVCTECASNGQLPSIPICPAPCHRCMQTVCTTCGQRLRDLAESTRRGIDFHIRRPELDQLDGSCVQPPPTATPARSASELNIAQRPRMQASDASAATSFGSSTSRSGLRTDNRCCRRSQSATVLERSRHTRASGAASPQSSRSSTATHRHGGQPRKCSSQSQTSVCSRKSNTSKGKAEVKSPKPSKPKISAPKTKKTTDSRSPTPSRQSEKKSKSKTGSNKGTTSKKSPRNKTKESGTGSSVSNRSKTSTNESCKRTTALKCESKQSSVAIRSNSADVTSRSIKSLRGSNATSACTSDTEQLYESEPDDYLPPAPKPQAIAIMPPRYSSPRSSLRNCSHCLQRLSSINGNLSSCRRSPRLSYTSSSYPCSSFAGSRYRCQQQLPFAADGMAWASFHSRFASFMRPCRSPVVNSSRATPCHRLAPQFAGRTKWGARYKQVSSRKRGSLKSKPKKKNQSRRSRSMENANRHYSSSKASRSSTQTSKRLDSRPSSVNLGSQSDRTDSRVHVTDVKTKSKSFDGARSTSAVSDHRKQLICPRRKKTSSANSTASTVARSRSLTDKADTGRRRISSSPVSRAMTSRTPTLAESASCSQAASVTSQDKGNLSSSTTAGSKKRKKEKSPTSARRKRRSYSTDEQYSRRASSVQSCDDRAVELVANLFYAEFMKSFRPGCRPNQPLPPCPSCPPPSSSREQSSSTHNRFSTASIRHRSGICGPDFRQTCGSPRQRLAASSSSGPRSCLGKGQGRAAVVPLSFLEGKRGCQSVTLRRNVPYSATLPTILPGSCRPAAKVQPTRTMNSRITSIKHYQTERTDHNRRIIGPAGTAVNQQMKAQQNRSNTARKQPSLNATVEGRRQHGALRTLGNQTSKEHRAVTVKTTTVTEESSDDEESYTVKKTSHPSGSQAQSGTSLWTASSGSGVAGSSQLSSVAASGNVNVRNNGSSAKLPSHTWIDTSWSANRQNNAAPLHQPDPPYSLHQRNQSNINQLRRSQATSSLKTVSIFGQSNSSTASRVINDVSRSFTDSLQSGTVRSSDAASNFQVMSTTTRPWRTTSEQPISAAEVAKRSSDYSTGMAGSLGAMTRSVTVLNDNSLMNGLFVQSERNIKESFLSMLNILR